MTHLCMVMVLFHILIINNKQFLGRVQLMFKNGYSCSKQQYYSTHDYTPIFYIFSSLLSYALPSYSLCSYSSSTHHAFFLVLCSVFFVLCSLFFVLCSLFFWTITHQYYVVVVGAARPFASLLVDKQRTEWLVAGGTYSYEEDSSYRSLLITMRSTSRLWQQHQQQMSSSSSTRQSRVQYIRNREQADNRIKK